MIALRAINSACFSISLAFVSKHESYFFSFARNNKPSHVKWLSLVRCLLLRSFEQLIYTQLDLQDKVGIAITFYVLALRSSTLPISVACVQLVGYWISHSLSAYINLYVPTFTHHCVTNQYDIANVNTQRCSV
jgi:hypothetical protein